MVGEVIPLKAGLIEESMVLKVKEGNDVEADGGRLLVMGGLEACPGTGSVLENALGDKATELTSGTPIVAKEDMASDKGVNVSVTKVSAEERISVSSVWGLFKI